MTGQGTITINLTGTTHNASSYVIGANRNHVKGISTNPDDTKNDIYIQRCIDQYGIIQPNFGNRRKIYRFGGTMTDGNGPNGIVYGVVMNGWHWATPNSGGVYIKNTSNGPYPYDNIDYYLEEAKKMNADMSITINFGSGTPEEAKALINYLQNYQYFGTTEKAIDRLKYLELGNEITWAAQFGNGTNHTTSTGIPVPEKSTTPYMYGQNAATFISKIREAIPVNTDPTKHIKIGLVIGENGQMTGDWGGTTAGNISEIFRGIKSQSQFTGVENKFDFLTFHPYGYWPYVQPNVELGTGDYNQRNVDLSNYQVAEKFLAANHGVYKKIYSLTKPITGSIAQSKQTYGITSNITLANTEYSSHLLIESRNPLRKNMVNKTFDAFVSADNMIEALKLNVEMAVNYCLYHPDTDKDHADNLFFNWFNHKSPSILPDPNTFPLNPKPVYYVHKLIAESMGDIVFDAESQLNYGDFDASNGLTFSTLPPLQLPSTDPNYNNNILNYPLLTYVTTKKTNGNIVLLVLNRSGSSPQTVNIQLQNVGSTNYTKVSKRILKSTSFEDGNFTDNYATVSPNINLTVPNQFSNTFDNLSITVLEFAPGTTTCTLASPTGIPTTQTISCNTAFGSAASCPVGTILWTNPSGTTSATPTPPTANGTFTYSAVCTSNSCQTSPAISTSVTVTTCGSTPGQSIKIPLSPPMISGVGVAGNEITKLIDEQNITTADLRITPIVTCGTCPNNPWIASWNPPYPTGGIKGVLDLGKEYDISHVFFHDGAGTGNTTLPFSIYKSNDGTTTNVEANAFASNALIGYNLWLRTDNLGSTVKRARYLVIVQPDNNTRCNEIILYGTEVSSCALSNITPPFSINGNTANFSVASGASLTLTNTSCPAGSTPKFYNSTTLGEVSSPITNFTTNTTYHSKCFLNASCISLKSADITVSINATTTCPLSVVSFTRNIPTDPNCRTYNLTVKANVAISTANPQTMKMTVIPGNGFDPSASTINGVSLNGNANYNSWVDNGAAHSWTINSLGTNVNAALSLKFCWVQPPYPNMVATLLGCNVTQTVVPVNGAKLMSSEEEMNSEITLFTIYPNPTNDKLTVEYSLTKDSEINFGIMDMTGKSLQNRVIDGKAGTHSFVMDVSKIIEGSYILRGITDDKSQAKKFVIVR
jgi:hypothetical protein